MFYKLNAFIVCMFLCANTANAQDHLMKIHHKHAGVDWTIPFEADKYKQWEISSDKKQLNAIAIRPDGSEMTIPYPLADIDSIDFSPALSDEEKGHNKYRPFSMHITTEGCANLVEKEVWLSCHISIDGKGEYSDYSGTGRIRGRGNSTWEWYDKKPYKFKLDEKSKLLGLEKAKNWNLLANWRDVTDMMNVLAFETARHMGLPHTLHTRFVEVFLNNQYIGTYQLTEKIEVGKNRVDIDEDEGTLLSFDLDDGPSLSPYATDNFWSSVFNLPLCVKHPEDPDATTLEKIKTDFASLEKAVKSHDYELVSSLMDIPSFISILQLHEYLFNVEIDAPRSLYMYRDKGGKYTFGPAWDWDAAYDFDWSDMYTGHTFFSNYRELIYGTDPLKATGANYNINKFWREMFANKTFVTQYKDTWSNLSSTIFTTPWSETQRYIDALTAEGTYKRDINQWPLLNSYSHMSFSPQEEINKMYEWLRKRKKNMDSVIANYPSGTDETAEIVDPSKITIVKTYDLSVDCSFVQNYYQSTQIYLDPLEIEELLGGSPTELVPLNADGSEGRNTAAGIYGAWFDDAGTQSWGNGAHVYIESDGLYTWKFGCHPDYCAMSHTHIVTMQYRRGAKAVNVNVRFNVIHE